MTGMIGGRGSGTVERHAHNGIIPEPNVENVPVSTEMEENAFDIF
jgi:hypothetical protein